MRLPRLRVLSAAVIPLVLLAACGSSKAEVKANALDSITVGGTAIAPTLTFKVKPVTVKATTAKVVTEGKGATLTTANSVIFNYALFNGKDGKQLETSFGKKAQGWDLSIPQPSAGLNKTLTQSLTGQHIGSRLLVAVPPLDAFGAQGNAQAGFGPTDSVILFLDLVSASTPLKTATGAPVAPKAGLPTATVDGAKAAVITVPKTAAPTTLIIQPLIKGAGEVVKAGQTIKVNYTGVLWKNGKKFDASGDRGTAFDTQIGAGKVVTGWDKGLVGQTIGSRMLLVVPPAEGYGAKGSPPLIGPTDTLVFVIDILAAT